MKRLNRKKIEASLARMSATGDPDRCCPNCGSHTVHLEDSRQEEATYTDRECLACGLHFTHVFRYHYTYASNEKGSVEFCDSRNEKPWNKYSHLDTLWALLRGLQMQGLFSIPEKGPIREALFNVAKLVPPEEWPMVIVSETSPAMLKEIAQEVLNGKH